MPLRYPLIILPSNQHHYLDALCVDLYRSPEEDCSVSVGESSISQVITTWEDLHNVPLNTNRYRYQCLVAWPLTTKFRCGLSPLRDRRGKLKLIYCGFAGSNVSQTGYKVVRTWGFGTTNNAATSTDVYYQVLNSSGQYFNYNPSNGKPSFINPNSNLR